MFDSWWTDAYRVDRHQGVPGTPDWSAGHSCRTDSDRHELGLGAQLWLFDQFRLWQAGFAF